jgi:hypothetical protein
VRQAQPPEVRDQFYVQVARLPNTIEAFEAQKSLKVVESR